MILICICLLYCFTRNLCLLPESVTDLPRTSKCLEGLILCDTEKLTRGHAFDLVYSSLRQCFCPKLPCRLANDLNSWVGKRRKVVGRSKTQGKPQCLSPEEGDGASQVLPSVSITQNCSSTNINHLLLPWGKIILYANSKYV